MKSTTLLLVILLTFLLIVRLFFHFSEQKTYEDGDVINLTHSFLQEPRKNNYGQYFFTGNILVTMPLYPKYSYGDVVELSGIVTKQKNEKGEILILKNPQIRKIERKDPILNLAIFVRGRIDEVVTTTIPPKEAGLFLGIILGVRDRIGNDFYEDLRSVGVLHIIAASGQNVSILASILLVTMATFVKRRLAILFTALIILFYSLLAGFDPPIVRASIMALISFGAMLMGRQSAGLFALAITGWIMVFITPQLISDISFQLSFLATFGIVTVKPILDSVLKIKQFNLIKEDLTTTLAAQVLTFPVMLSSFGAYSLLSLPVNLLVLWTIPPLMLVGILSLFASIVSPPISQPFIVLAYPMLVYFSFIVDTFAKIDLTMTVQNIPDTLILGYYLILIVIVIRYRRREEARI